ncbi:response regulator transcription factor [Streptosporangium amethystogenes]|uniref:response regulator transcription factor n=1 Tax=Streptosporangium amethystogenes TaxID=2002 RepID=UPI003794CB04
MRQLLTRTTHADPLSRLTPREREVLDLMAQGLTNASAAERLHVSQSAVEEHVTPSSTSSGCCTSPATPAGQSRSSSSWAEVRSLGQSR